MAQDPREGYTDRSNIEQKSYGVEELQVVGEQLLAKVKELIHEGNVRRIIIKQDGNSILELPLTIGVAGVLLAPALAAVGVLGALLTQCSIEVVRTDSPADYIERKVEEIRDDVPPAL
ncbi:MULTISPECIES: DUF4342 domain-containing protein [Ktedonobacter]|uniref:DUF4342 domain-containing protein n=2 Tax=Ktedonobacter TaxID=363276 RepID=D6U6S8_KTERA|nr:MULTISPECIES: DUF4342 domain-containing protein [Ktedonobacter]EFH80689.1 hypothetical protein Krac_1305 [Ktedonobacter racemifer DSM 44963]GHO60269.1 hypothetical protein KSB_87440 [Ktedonobacter robiniae]